MHSTSQNWWEVHSLWFRSDFLIFFKLLFSLGKFSFWLIVISWLFYPSILKTTKFTNFHRPHSVFPDFQSLEKLIPFFFPNFQRLQTLSWKVTGWLGVKHQIIYLLLMSLKNQHYCNFPHNNLIRPGFQHIKWQGSKCIISTPWNWQTLGENLSISTLKELVKCHVCIIQTDITHLDQLHSTLLKFRQNDSTGNKEEESCLL